MKRLAEGGEAQTGLEISSALSVPEQKDTITAAETVTPTVATVKTGEEVPQPTLTGTPTVTTTVADPTGSSKILQDPL